jgi:hypothetical protein
MEDYVSGYDDYIANMMKGAECSWAAVGGYMHPQPGSGLVSYGMNACADKTPNPTTTVYCNFLEGLDTQAQPTALSDTVYNYCKASSVKKILVGHQPLGDCPTLIATNDLMAICGDTSYASNTTWQNINPLLYFQVEDSSKYP